MKFLVLTSYDWRELVGMQMVGICHLLLVWTSGLVGEVGGFVDG